MRGMLQKLNSIPLFVIALGTVAVLDAADHKAKADAAENVGAAASVVSGQVSNVGTLALAGMFLVGVFFVGAGLMKLKQAADSNGQQVKYGEGLWRLGVGAGLVAVPAATGMLTASLGLGSVAPSGTGAVF